MHIRCLNSIAEGIGKYLAARNKDVIKVRDENYRWLWFKKHGEPKVLAVMTISLTFYCFSLLDNARMTKAPWPYFSRLVLADARQVHA